MIWGLLSEFWPVIAGAVLAVVAYFTGRSNGKNKTEVKFHEDKQRREAAGRDRLREGRDSGLSPADRVRRNDGDWGGV